jgi:manganese-dependent inorganic pyrophosphatase
MSTPPITESPTSPIKRVLEIIRDRKFTMVPIVSDGELRGNINIMGIASILISETDVERSRRVNTTVRNILQCLNGTLITGEEERKFENGNFVIGAMDVKTLKQRMKTYYGFDNIVLVGDREDAQKVIIASGAKCLIITGGFPPSEEVVRLAEGKEAVIIVSPYDTMTTARLVKLSASIETQMMGIQSVSPETRLSEARGIIINTPTRALPVVDELGKVVGVITGTDILKAKGKRVILVDHNETFQAVDGIEEAEIIEIIDHHRMGNLQSTTPIYFTGEPVGSTATLIAEKFERHYISPSREIAGILLAGILSDTLLFRSPITTQKDREIAKRLSLIAGVEVEWFGVKMFHHGSDIGVKSAAELLMSNYKEYCMNDKKIGIGQLETVDIESALKLKDEFQVEVDKLRESHNLEVGMMVLTDLLQEGSIIIFSGNSHIMEMAFPSINRGETFLKGILSRKKQILPAIGRAIKSFYQTL